MKRCSCVFAQQRAEAAPNCRNISKKIINPQNRREEPCMTCTRLLSNTFSLPISPTFSLSLNLFSFQYSNLNKFPCELIIYFFFLQSDHFKLKKEFFSPDIILQFCTMLNQINQALSMETRGQQKSLCHSLNRHGHCCHGDPFRCPVVTSDLRGGW